MSSVTNRWTSACFATSVQSPGSFRCHDGDHASTDSNAAIAQDCTACHVPLAVEEAAPGVLGHRQARKKYLQEAGDRTIKVTACDAGRRGFAVGEVVKDGPGECLTVLQPGQRFELWLDFIADNVEGCAWVRSGSNCLEKARPLGAHGHAVHDVHDTVDNAPRDVAAPRRLQ
jgi:hypothetical protein